MVNCRLLLKEIRRLRDEHEEASRSAAQIAQNPQLLAELKLLRQRKDELELRMSALQESRRELMVQLEGLMNLLKVGSTSQGLLLNIVAEHELLTEFLDGP